MGLENKCQVRHSIDSSNELHAFFKRTVQNRMILSTDDSLSMLVGQLAQHLIDANPELQRFDYEVLINRAASVNAFAVGNHRIQIQVGLLEQATTIDEIAFVIAHEFAHDHLTHTWEKIRFNAETSCDKSIVRAERLLRKGKADYYEQEHSVYILDTKLREGLYNSRQEEFQADSVGIGFLINAGFDQDAGKRMMDILANSDDPFALYHDTLDFKGMYDLGDVVFKPSWLSSERVDPLWPVKGDFYSIDEVYKTHPNTDERKERLEMKSFVQRPADYAELEDMFAQNQPRVPFHILHRMVEKRFFGVALFRCMHLQQVYPDNAYLHAVHAWCLFHLYKAMKTSKYTLFVNFPNSKFCQSYNKYLAFLHNMNSKRLKMFFDNYYEAHCATIGDHDLMSFVHLLNQEMNDEGNNVRLFQAYAKTHPTYFKTYIEQFLYN